MRLEFQYRQLRIGGQVIDQHRAVGDSFLSPTFTTMERLHKWLFERGLIPSMDRVIHVIRKTPKRKPKIKLGRIQKN